MIFALSILLLVFLARPLFSSYSDAQSQLESSQATLATKDAEYQKILTLESEVQQGGSGDVIELTQKIQQNFSQSDILETVMINDFTRSSALGAPQVVVESASVDPGAKLPSGISRATVTLSLRANSVDAIVSYLSYLTQDTSRAFILDNVNLPLDTQDTNTNTPVSVNVTLGVYYYR